MENNHLLQSPEDVNFVCHWLFCARPWDEIRSLADGKYTGRRFEFATREELKAHADGHVDAACITRPFGPVKSTLGSFSHLPADHSTILISRMDTSAPGGGGGGGGSLNLLEFAPGPEDRRDPTGYICRYPGMYLRLRRACFCFDDDQRYGPCADKCAGESCSHRCCCWHFTR